MKHAFMTDKKLIKLALKSYEMGDVATASLFLLEYNFSSYVPRDEMSLGGNFTLRDLEVLSK